MDPVADGGRERLNGLCLNKTDKYVFDHINSLAKSDVYSH
jgi:hypothetical protein